MTHMSHQMNFIWKTQKGLGWNDYSWFGATYINRGLKREPKIKKPNLLEPLDLCMWRGVKDVVPTWCPLVIWIVLLLKTKTKEGDGFQHSFLELMWSLNISHNYVQDCTEFNASRISIRLSQFASLLFSTSQSHYNTDKKGHKLSSLLFKEPMLECIQNLKSV